MSQIESIMIHVIATIELVPGTRAAFLAEFHKLVPQVHAESGCLEYGPAVDIASELSAQIPLREDVVTVVEKWTDIAALKAHLVAPHMMEYRPRVKDMVKGTTLQVLGPA
jgi:quinol monooxygenase YgiN